MNPIFSRVVLALWDGGPQTGRELEKRTGHTGDRKRLSELRDKKLVRNVAWRNCEVSGRKAKVWELTGAGIKISETCKVEVPPNPIVDTEKGPTVYCAVLDGVVMEASTGKKPVVKFCKSAGVPLYTMKPTRVERFKAKGTAAMFNDPEIFPEGK